MAEPQRSLCREGGEKCSWRAGETLALAVVFGQVLGQDLREKPSGHGDEAEKISKRREPCWSNLVSSAEVTLVRVLPYTASSWAGVKHLVWEILKLNCN